MRPIRFLSMIMFSIAMLFSAQFIHAQTPDNPQLQVSQVIPVQDLAAPAVATVATAPDLAGIFGTFAALIALIPFIVQLFRKLLPNLSSMGSQIFSWLIGIILTMFGWYFNLGFLAGMTWWLAMLYGFGASLAANGIFDIGIIEWILSLVGIKKKATTPA